MTQLSEGSWLCLVPVCPSVIKKIKYISIKL